MKVLSVQQPWASLIVAGIKDIENRTWKPKVNPGRILIHASKKCSERTIYNEPIEWVQEILNERFLGNIPDYPDMPNNAIIGCVTIERIDKDNAYSVWAAGESDDENLFYWHLKDACIFEKPIVDVKGKLWLWDYDIEENKLPLAYDLLPVLYGLNDKDFNLPVSDEFLKGLAANLFLNLELSISLQGTIINPDTLKMKPLETITFYNFDGRERTFKLTEKSGPQPYVDEKGEIISNYYSVFNPDGAERWVMHFEWAEEIK